MSGLIADGEVGLSQADTGTAWLVAVAGPAIEPLKLEDNAGGLILGRGDSAQLKLPLTAEKVSRAHCRLACTGGTWTITDASKWGTFVNGVRLQVGHEVILREGDTIRIAPWTFGFSTVAPRQRGMDLADDTAGTQDVRAVEDASARQLAGHMVDLLAMSTEKIHAARSEKELAETLIEVALNGTGLTNAAVLKVVDFNGRVEPIALRQAPGTTGQQLYSRSLVARAREGQVAELRIDSMSGNIGESVMQMKISAAICAPLMIGDGSAPAGERDVAALLYLDARAGNITGTRTQSNAAGFVMALARIGSLALANIKRIDMIGREREREHDERAAAEAQRLILPAREGRVGAFQYFGESRPGQLLGGDFFDVVPVGQHKLAIALGDVTGKGIPASVLMTASFGFLHSLLETGHDVATASRMLTKFLHPRRPASRFVTLWVGVFDLNERTLTYADCGHGWAMLQHADGTYTSLDSGGGLPVGIDGDGEYIAETVELKPGSRAVIVSDGFVEQFGLTVDAAGKPVRDQFGMTGIRKSLAKRQQGTAGSDDLKSLYDAVIAYAGTTQLADDATGIIVAWD